MSSNEPAALIEADRVGAREHIYGITDARRFGGESADGFLHHGRIAPRRLAERLADEGFYVWDGNYYALAVTERHGVERAGHAPRWSGALQHTG